MTASRSGTAAIASSRQRRGGARPAEHAILGLLASASGAGHGYDLARHFAPGQPLAEVIRLEPAMLYHHLKRLTAAGWVTATLEPQIARPARQVHAITPAGQAELRRWLAEPVAHTREIRLDFLVKLYFARQLDPALARRLIDEQRVLLDRLATSLAERRGAIATNTDVFIALVLDLRLAQTEAAVAWLARANENTVLP
ncbi:MAG: PadR family transcriptional regulator [Chloroflexota bacterium]|nr:PadR family transcriptional regulator [Chloroflexota bacterium]